MKLAALTLFGCLVAAPLAAQQPASSPAPAPQTAGPAAQNHGGPRVQQDFPAYQPPAARHDAAVAADKTTITISTLGLVLIAVLLILLLT